MSTLAPDALFQLGDNVYNDGIQNWGADGYGSPYGNSLQDSMSDAGEDYLKVRNPIRID